MNTANTSSRKALLLIMLFATVLFLLVNIAFYASMKYIFANMAIKGTVTANIPEVVGLINKINVVQSSFKFYFVPASAAVFLLLALIFWLMLRKMMTPVSAAEGEVTENGDDEPSESAQARRKEQKAIERRIYLHLLSVFQREGRLVDFFAEDINIYDDAQIGAAVRNIHENCKKTILKYVSPRAVLEQDEGLQVTIEEGFDPDQIKLTGNVTGDPPFKGILRHKGWKAAKLEVPTFSSTQEEDIIAPAEVEII